MDNKKVTSRTTISARPDGKPASRAGNKPILRYETVLIINNVRSILNVGSMFRTADGAGVREVILCGYTPTPANQPEKIAKTALGAEKTVPWRQSRQAWRLLKELKQEGYRIVALEQHGKSKDIFKYRPRRPLALLVGNEVKGLSRDVLKYCDDILEIPMYGKKESLNVSVAAGVALYQLKIKS